MHLCQVLYVAPDAPIYSCSTIASGGEHRPVPVNEMRPCPPTTPIRPLVPAPTTFRWSGPLGEGEVHFFPFQAAMVKRTRQILLRSPARRRDPPSPSSQPLCGLRETDLTLGRSEGRRACELFAWASDIRPLTSGKTKRLRSPKSEVRGPRSIFSQTLGAAS